MSGGRPSAIVRVTWFASLWLSLSLPLQAQSEPHPAMTMPTAMPASEASVASPASPSRMRMDGMAMPDSPGGTERRYDPKPTAMSAMSEMAMGAMQGGPAPVGARSPDYSDGMQPSMLPGMDMADDAAIGRLLFDQLEARSGHQGQDQTWELQGWYGNDTDKLRLRSEGERRAARVGDGDLEALWSHAIAIYWDTTFGLRQDIGDGPHRRWLAFGVQGLAPYGFETAATGYLGSSGHAAVRLRADRDLLFTQRLILQPELEANLYRHDEPVRGIGRGLSNLQFGLRLRYEIRRELAPYVGWVFSRRFGRSAELTRAQGGAVFDRQFVAGLRLWF